MFAHVEETVGAGSGEGPGTGTGGGDTDGKSAVLAGRLIDRDTREVLWETEQMDKVVTLGLIPTLLGGHREEAICGALKKIAEAVPPVYSGGAAPR